MKILTRTPNEIFESPRQRYAFVRASVVFFFIAAVNIFYSNKNLFKFFISAAKIG